MKCPRSMVALTLGSLILVGAAPARAADPIKIGMVVPLTGAIAESGKYGIQGAKLAIEEVNTAGGVLGRPLELVIEDDQSANPTTILAFNKLAGDNDIVAFLGPTRSTQIQAMSPAVVAMRLLPSPPACRGASSVRAAAPGAAFHAT